MTSYVLNGTLGLDLSDRKWRLGQLRTLLKHISTRHITIQDGPKIKAKSQLGDLMSAFGQPFTD